jgi:hypothetical protein
LPAPAGAGNTLPKRFFPWKNRGFGLSTPKQARGGFFSVGNREVGRVHYISAKGCRLCYETTGQGKPLVLIHGLGSDHRMWTSQIEAFASHYRVIAYNCPSHPPQRVAGDSGRLRSFLVNQL